MQEADRLEIEDLIVPDRVQLVTTEGGATVVKDLPKPVRHISVKGGDDLRRLLEDLRPSDEPLSSAHDGAVDLIDRGRIIGRVYPPRLSSPKFECRLAFRSLGGDRGQNSGSESKIVILKP